MDFSQPLAGMRSAESRLDTVALNLTQVANYRNEGANGGATSADAADLSANAVALLMAGNDFVANVKMLHVQDEMEKSTFSLFA